MHFCKCGCGTPCRKTYCHGHVGKGQKFEERYGLETATLIKQRISDTKKELIQQGKWVNPAKSEEATNGQPLLIEVYGTFFKKPDYEFERAKVFAASGYRTLFLNDNDILRQDCEETCLSKIDAFLKDTVSSTTPQT
jgi:hypothetical protein